MPIRNDVSSPAILSSWPTCFGGRPCHRWAAEFAGRTAMHPAATSTISGTLDAPSQWGDLPLPEIRFTTDHTHTIFLQPRSTDS